MIDKGELLAWSTTLRRYACSLERQGTVGKQSASIPHRVADALLDLGVLVIETHRTVDSYMGDVDFTDYECVVCGSDWSEQNE